MTHAAQELGPQDLIRRCHTADWSFETTNDLPPLSDFIGQERAIRAVDFGAGIASHGFNIYALGLPGSGRTTLTRKFLEQIASGEPTPEDWCYVNNFDDPQKPQALRLPAGQGTALREDMNLLIEHCKQGIAKAFESDEYQQEREQITGQYERQQENELEVLQERLKVDNFALVKVPGGLVLTPAVEGRPLKERELEKLSDEERAKVQRLRAKLEKSVEQGLQQLREIDQAMHQELKQLDTDTTLRAIGHLVADLKEKYIETSFVTDYLECVKQDIVTNVDDFRDEKKDGRTALAGLSLGAPAPNLTRYQVNVLVDNTDTRGAPVIVESNPTYHNLMGRIEHHAFMGSLATDFTMIKPGAFHRANGGYLVLPVRDVLTNYLSWDALKRTLKDQQIRIEELGAQLSLVSTLTLEPQTIPLDVKVVLIGNPLLYYLLHVYDEDFEKLFKVKADFATLMDRTPETEQQYALFVRTICQEQGLEPFDRGAVARVIEQSARVVEHQNKLSTRFGEIADLLQEANFWASRRLAEATVEDLDRTVSAEDVDRAIREKVFRSNLVEERIQEVIAEGTLHIDTTGQVIGQVNGLSVIFLGGYQFGRPNRVTASTFVGKAGVVDIEREVELGGPIHSKGVLIISSYLGYRFAQNAPLGLSANLVFEQSYSGIEGDSASSAELYALLSSLSGFPIKQELAVTGSVDQHGRVQPIGGVNQKIEGFFDACKARGLTGDQGVIIPAANLKHLMLRQDVVDTVTEKRFHIWAVETVDEGIALLTGRDAGEPDAGGAFPEGTVNHAVARRLAEIAEAQQEDKNGKQKDAPT
jgi:lon-related putative ATP-dependent protease